MSHDGKPMIETKPVPEDVIADVTRKALADAIQDDASVPEKKPPSGTVERTLNFWDRNLIIGALRNYCKGEKAKYKGQFKLDRITKLLQFEETLEYFNLMNDAAQEELFAWQEKKQAYASYRMWKGGMLKLEEFKAHFPGLDLDKCPEKPPVGAPEQTPKERRGEDRTFHIPAKLDVFIQEALREMEWNSLTPDLSSELCAKYGFEPEEK